MVAQPRKSFADYYQEAQAGQGLAPKKPAAKFDVSQLKPVNPTAGEPIDDPLSWLVDIVQRPLYGVTNTVQKTVNAVTDANKRASHGDTDFLRNAGEIMGAASPLSFLEGMFSNSPEVKRSTSDVIEQSTDKIGSLDPNYEDVKDNVNPVLKGVAGFAGDVLGDPLTYIPGGLIVKGAKALKTGSEAVIDGTKAVIDTTKAAQAAKKGEKAAEAVPKAEAKTPVPTKATAVETMGARTAADETDATVSRFPEMADLLKPGATTQELVPFDKAFRDQQFLPTSKANMDAALSTPRAGQLAEALATAKPKKVQEVVQQAVDVKTAKPLTFGPNPEVAGSRGWVGELDDLIDGAEKLSDLPKIPFKGKPTSIAAVRIEAEKGTPEAITALREVHQKYQQGFAKAKAQGMLINALGKPVEQQAAKSVETVYDSMTAFRRELATSEERLTGLLGPSLVKNLREYTNPETFDRTVSTMRGILDRSIDVHSLSRLTPPVQRMLREIGVDPGEIPLNMHRPSGASRTAAPPKTIDEMVSPEARSTVDRMADPEEATPTVEAIELAEDAIRHGINKDIIQPKTPDAFPFTSRDGTMRTSELFGDGVGRRLREANNYFQFTLFQPLVGKVSTRVKSYGRAHAAEKRVRTLQALRLAERWYDENGVPLTIGVGLDRIPLSMSQIVDALERVNLRGMQVFMWNLNSAVPPTNLMDAVYNAIKTGSRADIETALRQTTTRYAHSDGSVKSFRNNLVTPQHTKGGRVIGKETFTGDELVKGLADTIEDALPILRSVVEDNAKRYAGRQAMETLEISDDVLGNLENVFATRQGYGELLEELTDTSSRIVEAAARKGAMQTSVELANATIKAHIPVEDMANAVAAKETVSAIARGDVKAAKARQQRHVEEVAARQDPFVPGGKSVDLGEHTDQILSNTIKAKVVPVFSKRAGNELLHDRWRSVDVLFRNTVGDTAHRLSALSKALPREQLAPLLSNVQKGVKHSDPAMQGYQDELADIWGQMFGSETRNSLIDNAFFRNNGSVHHINSVFTKFGLDDYLFDADKAAQLAKKNGTSVAEEMAKQSVEWTISDPAETLNKLFTSFMTVQTHTAIAQHFVKIAKDLGATARKPAPGYALVGNDSGKSLFSAYLPDDLYFKEDVLHQMHVVDNLAQQTMDLKGPLGNFINNVYRPAQDAWKYGMTLINPTHHIRNLNSDFSLTFYAEGMQGSKGSINAALQAMATRNGYSNWDAIKSLQGINELPDAGKIIAKGKLGEITADGLYTAMANRGNLPGFKTIEQLEDTGRGGLAEAWQRTTETRGARLIGGVSEARDHFARLQHAAQFINKNIDSKQYKTLDEMLDAAAEQVRKWHPDGSDMTRSEQYFRLVIPFYSWQRKAIPLIVEAMLTQPARVMALPKAQQAIATSMGVNPDSLADPFPDDQMFPSFMTSQLTGPVAKLNGAYYGINPGFAANDILSDYVGSNPVNTVLNSVSPLIKAPFELATESRVGGASINDKSDYIDSQIPIVSTLSRLTGKSVTGSAVSIPSTGKLDNQYQIDKGNVDPAGGPLMALTNWLSGLGLQNMSQANYVNYAEIERRNKEGEQRGF